MIDPLYISPLEQDTLSSKEKMAGSYQPKTLPSSLKSSSSSTTPTSSSTINSMKLKAIVQSFIFSHLYRVIRALAKAKSILFQLVKNVHLVHLVEFPMLNKKNKTNKNDKLFLGSFRLHYNWCSSHVMPVPVPAALEDCSTTGHVCYDSTWNSIISTSACDEAELSGYLRWLEEKAPTNPDDNNNNNNTNNGNDIDKLADMFIANCHERFRLEKVESYRRFQEMLARSV